MRLTVATRKMPFFTSPFFARESVTFDNFNSLQITFEDTQQQPHSGVSGRSGRSFGL